MHARPVNRGSQLARSSTSPAFGFPVQTVLSYDPVEPLMSLPSPVFLGETFAAGTDLAAAGCRRQRFFVAAMILFMPSGLILRFGFGGSGVEGDGGSLSPLILAHRAFCARAIFFLAAALNFLRLPARGSEVTAGLMSAAFFAAGVLE